MPIPTESFLKKFLKESGGKFPTVPEMQRGTGSLEQNARDLTMMNGTTDMMGMPSQGAQELAQNVEQNKKTGILQRVAGFLNKLNPFDNMFPDNRVDYTSPDGTIQKVNPDFLKLIMNRPDLKERFDSTGSIYSTEMP
ncbi:MAG: hypothetical protein MK083_06465 [Dehalococcoidia bacterium]|nr:hypothetical protein [Dehalococcoidia bacterium]